MRKHILYLFTRMHLYYYYTSYMNVLKLKQTQIKVIKIVT